MVNKNQVIANLREKREALEAKLKLVRKLVEEELPQIGQTIDFRRGFYKATGFEVPEWFKSEMGEDDKGEEE